MFEPCFRPQIGPGLTWNIIQPPCVRFPYELPLVARGGKAAILQGGDSPPLRRPCHAVRQQWQSAGCRDRAGLGLQVAQRVWVEVKPSILKACEVSSLHG